MTKPTKKLITEQFRIPCFFCNQPIHIDEFGGIFSEHGSERYVHNNIVCLSKLAKFQKLSKRCMQ